MEQIRTLQGVPKVWEAVMADNGFLPRMARILAAWVDNGFLSWMTRIPQAWVVLDYPFIYTYPA